MVTKGITNNANMGKSFPRMLSRVHKPALKTPEPARYEDDFEVFLVDVGV
jgi:hypothetical protein